MFELYAYDYSDNEILFLRSRERMTRFAALSWAAHNADLIGAESFRVLKDGEVIFFIDKKDEDEDY